ncbi:MAG: ribokinase [Candidatus Limnocylindria bacterium]
MVSGRVVVLGSINVDFVVVADRLPMPGETVLGGRFAQHAGGKGANQAVAAARAGARVVMIGAVGDDALGDAAITALAEEGVDVSHVSRIGGQQTGVAIIAVGARGENQIVVAPGANAAVDPDEHELATIASAEVLLTGFEISMPGVIAGLRAAHDAAVRSILNPAPAHALPAEILSLGPVLTPNEHELVVAIGNDDVSAALDELAARNAGPVVVTQGPAGALLADGQRRDRFHGYPATEIDTTGAGDTFCGVLAAWLADGSRLEDAIRAANAAGSLSVGAVGARSGMPTHEAIIERMGQPPA